MLYSEMECDNISIMLCSENERFNKNPQNSTSINIDTLKNKDTFSNPRKEKKLESINNFIIKKIKFKF